MPFERLGLAAEATFQFQVGVLQKCALRRSGALAYASERMPP